MNAKNGDGKTGFHYAFESGRIELVKVLIKNSVEFNIDLEVTDRDGTTGFHYACQGVKSK